MCGEEHQGGALPIYCSIPMLRPQGYGFWHVLSLLRVCFSWYIFPFKCRYFQSIPFQCRSFLIVPYKDVVFKIIPINRYTKPGYTVL